MSPDPGRQGRHRGEGLNFELQENVCLAPYTSLELGGPARYFVEIKHRRELREALVWAHRHRLRVHALAGGSNVVVADDGFDGLILHISLAGLDLQRTSEGGRVVAQAGEPWESVVDATVDAGLGGVECLTGIPGSVGATPIQNVGAYGQEVSNALDSIEVLDMRTLETEHWTPRRCQFGYRSSIFKRQPGHRLVLSASYHVRSNTPPCLDYPQLRDALDYRSGRPTPTLGDVREAVRLLRGAKSMLLDREDENGKSAGSFFTNPILPTSELNRIRTLVCREAMVERPDQLPVYPVPGDPTHQKLSAAWLIEKAGTPKGTRRGGVGVSSRHSLALVHHGGGSTDQLLGLAREIREKVSAVFDIGLAIEPTLLGDIES